tara:strand:- start:1531 stop:1872 length:342 start_codon:yes stop_codon:yes gene_type:complete
MDTQTLLTESKARFGQHSARAYLKDKYDSKLIVADQGGLWKADRETISFLSTRIAEAVQSEVGMHVDQYCVCIDTFGNPVKVNQLQLLDKLKKVYRGVMEEWHTEWAALENKR